MNDTIFAPATAAGRAAVAVVRISGPGAREALNRLVGRVPRARMAALRTVRDAGGAPIDQALALWFPGPASYTGEDCAELHIHGGAAVVDALVEVLAGQGLRLAEAGEFTRRAFENGKLDLAQAEGVADLIDAETDAQRRQALGQLEGALSQAQARWRDVLTEALAVLEAAIDFPDEEVPADVAARARPVLEGLMGDLRAAIADAERGERVRQGFRIALIGAPNAGKSTLLNALAGRDAAIVTAQAGTTRDVIEVPLVLAGYKVLMADTAGIRATEEEIEAEGVRRALAWADGADLRLWVVDGSLDEEPSAPEALRAGDVCVVTKADLPAGRDGDLPGGFEVVRMSAKSAQDVRGLTAQLERRVVEALSGSESGTATRVRHRALLEEALERLTHALASEEAVELAAEDVRLAARALDRITGRIGSEDVLDRIFASFCIGK